MPDNRHKPGDEHAGGRKPGRKKPRPEGGFGGPGGPRPEGGYGGRRPDRPRFDGPKSFGPRPGGGPGGPRPDRPRFDGPKSFGPRPGGGYGGRQRPVPGFGGPRPGSGAPDRGPVDRQNEGQPRPPEREWQPTDAWTPRPPRPFGHFGPRPGAPGPRPERGGFGFGDRRPEAAPHRPPRPTPPDRDFDDIPPGAAGPVPAESGRSAEFSAPAGRPPRPPRRPDYRARSGGYPERRQFRPGPTPQAAWSRPPVSPPPADLLGEDEEIVAGRHPVEEAFIARRKAVRLLVVPQRRQALEKLVLHATNLRIPIVEVEGGTLTSLAGFDGHQGIALVTDRRGFAGLDDLLARAIERQEPPFVIVLDSLEDPQNFGSLLRTAEASGVHGVVYPTHRQAPLSPAAIKASAGAVEHLLLVPVDDLAEALTDLHVRGLRIVGSDADAPLTARQADLRGPVAIVVGSEGQGLGPAVRRRCDTVVRIPMRGHVTSLNASVAGSILLYEASSQRGGDRPLITPEAQELAALEPAALEPTPEPAGPIDDGSGAQVAPAAAGPKPRRRATARAGAPDQPPAGSADELLPGGPAASPDGPPAAPPKARRSRA
ncbi:MAG: 23S rRNA (guanosine(2251)-2'-O)-methyltransferase RlmB [Candidatus Limnocylindrales bacterium]